MAGLDLQLAGGDPVVIPPAPTAPHDQTPCEAEEIGARLASADEHSEILVMDDLRAIKAEMVQLIGRAGDEHSGVRQVALLPSAVRRSRI